jgi:hypothetical protein
MVLNHFNFEKLISADATVIGRANILISNINIRMAIGYSDILQNFHTND